MIQVTLSHRQELVTTTHPIPLTNKAEILEFARQYTEKMAGSALQNLHNMRVALEKGIVMPETAKIWKRIIHQLSMEQRLTMH